MYGVEATTRPPWDPSWSAEGVISALEPLALPRRSERIRTAVADRLESVTLLMDAPHDPHNGAAILRSADAFGIQHVHVLPRVEPFLISGAVAQGTERWVDVTLHESVDEATAHLRSQDFTLVTTHPEGTLCPEDLAGIPRLALVLGNERDGICDALARAASHSVRVPMRGFVESLNVSVTAAILLHAATRSRPGDLNPEQRQRLYARGLFRSVPRANEVLAALSPS